MLESVLDIRNLTKRFGDFAAVSDISLEMARGEVFALLGPNGAGKTTTIRMLMGLLQPTSGTAFVEHLNCFTERVEAQRRIGYLPDEPIFYDYLRGREIINFVGEMHGLSSLEIARRAAPLVERLALGEALEEYAANYSQGMKKKLAIVCALLHEPLLLILDEPTNGLDPFATRTVHTMIRELAAAGKSVFFSTHLLDQAEKLCNRVGIVYRSRLVAVGRLDELRARLSADSSLEEIFFSFTQEPSPTEPSGT
jgi:ABC-2 type transport system ATP-binding protein